jgi:hypothetical protein
MGRPCHTRPISPLIFLSNPFFPLPDPFKYSILPLEKPIKPSGMTRILVSLCVGKLSFKTRTFATSPGENTEKC